MDFVLVKAIDAVPFMLKKPTASSVIVELDRRATRTASFLHFTSTIDRLNRVGEVCSAGITYTTPLHQQYAVCMKHVAVSLKDKDTAVWHPDLPTIWWQSCFPQFIYAIVDSKVYSLNIADARESLQSRQRVVGS